MDASSPSASTARCGAGAAEPGCGAGGRGPEGAGEVGRRSPTWGAAGAPTDSEARRRAGREREAGAFGLEEPGEPEPPQTQQPARGAGPRPLGAGDQPGQFLGDGGRRDVSDVMRREEREPRKEPAMEGQTRAGGEDGQGERAARREVCAIPGGGQVHRAGFGQRVHPGGARARES